MEAWSLRLSLVVLGIATVVTAVVAEILVGSIEAFAESVGLTNFFVAAIIVAIVGNAAEHGGAIVVAARGKIKLAAEIALSSSAQVAVFLIPVVQILSFAIDPLALLLSAGSRSPPSPARCCSRSSSLLVDIRAGSAAGFSWPRTSGSRLRSSSRRSRATPTNSRRHPATILDRWT